MTRGYPRARGAELPGAARLSAVLAAGCGLLAILLPIADAYYLSVSGPQVLAEKLGIAAALQHRAGLTNGLAIWRHALIVIVGLLPVVLISYGLLRARRCFRAFARGEYFSLAAVSGLRGLAAGMFFSSLAGLLVPPLSSAILTVGAVGHGGSIAVNVSSNELLLMLFGGIVWQIAAVLGKAARLAEENAQFV